MMASKTKKWWGWAACLMAALAVGAAGCQPSASSGTTRNPSTTGKQPDNKDKPVTPPKPDVG
jgi:hypothetical protein